MSLVGLRRVRVEEEEEGVVDEGKIGIDVRWENGILIISPRSTLTA